ncbi:RNA polymerase sigma-70 factor [Mucilaginibacter phyllosphaerae]|uniref:RNA polymerase sigma-70 factor n=1 Tax=Mucilaginibacter phyllosphaerae TaxID=1812349 RepID=A0A4Y8AI38_9SPHI|nr:RNA polymerase sigma-70 factor [Mucilaginibacter phyllosphaerae]MBB3968249.1 RNA polymerase sigma-70 factor (ECF subfamily) [Mucilaginibacter phyllosphaerae]TEW68744.1 RNA polymerase sigma-70 factor [Mucilaginibacter phyllosphaerae]GGH00224.1 DNA-directed RNA polymerase sigma-70 factor [Mucilaginibacter phyllosphaerae]
MFHDRVAKYIEAIQNNGDKTAFNELYLLLEAKIYNFAFSFLGERETAQEITNDAFLKLWLNREKLSAINNLQVYLYVLVKNACLNHLRSVSLKQIKEPQLTERFYFTISTDPSQLLISKELKERLLKEINKLPPRCKLIFKMVKEDDLSCNEVAAILGLSNKTVFAQLAIALARIEAALGL